MKDFLKVILYVIVLVILVRLAFITYTHYFPLNKSGKSVENVVISGKVIFDKNCSRCHGADGVGLVKNWKESYEDGKFPAPPLNGTAHSWHHSPKNLMRTINEGGKRLGGTMPGFKDELVANDKHSLLVYIYSLWPLEIQKNYDQKFKTTY